MDIVAIGVAAKALNELEENVYSKTEVSSLISNLESDVTESISKLNWESLPTTNTAPVVINDFTGKVLNADNALGSTRVFNYPITETRILDQVSLNCVTGGTVLIKIFTKNANGTFNWVKDIPITTEAGLNTIELNEPLEAGYYLGVYSSATKTKTVAEFPGTSYVYVSGTNVTTQNTTMTTAPEGTFMGVSFSTVVPEATSSMYLDVDAKTIGTIADGTAMTAGATRLLNYKYINACLLKKLGIFAKSTGTLKVKSFVSDDDVNFTMKSEVSVTVVSTGSNVFDLNLPIYENGYIGLYSQDVQFALSTTGGSVRYWTCAGKNVISSDTFELSGSSYHIFARATTVGYIGLNHSNSSNSDVAELKNYSNNINPLFIETMDKTNQPLHPSVLYIDDGFADHKYWMVQTPFPDSYDRYECPHIYYSDDGVEWFVPEGLTNPIDDLTAPEIANHDYFSDPHLVYKDGVLECWYRITRVDEETYPGYTLPTWVLRKTSTDGVIWSEREVLINLQDPTNNGVGDMVRSPAIRWDGSKYQMWYVDKLTATPRNVVYAQSTNGTTWTGKTTCTLNDLTDDNWHIDVSYSNGKYHLLVYGETYDNINYYTGTTATVFTFVKELLRKSPVLDSNFSHGLYRSCLAWNGTHYLLYFTAKKGTKYSLMLAAGTDVESLAFVDGAYFRRIQSFEKGIRLANNGVMNSNILLGDTGDSIEYDYWNRRLVFKKDDADQRIGNFVPVPLSATAAGRTGDFSADVDFFYVCWGNDSWIRIAKSAW